VTDSAGATLSIRRDYKMAARELVPPGGQRCSLAMDGMGQLGSFTDTSRASTVAVNHAFTFIYLVSCCDSVSVVEWLACWTQAQKGLGSIGAATLSRNSRRQTVHTHRASVHQAAKLVAALLRVARVTAGMADSNGSLPPGL